MLLIKIKTNKSKRSRHDENVRFSDLAQSDFYHINVNMPFPELHSKGARCGHLNRLNTFFSSNKDKDRNKIRKNQIRKNQTGKSVPRYDSTPSPHLLTCDFNRFIVFTTRIVLPLTRLRGALSKFFVPYLSRLKARFPFILFLHLFYKKIARIRKMLNLSARHVEFNIKNKSKNKK